MRVRSSSNSLMTEAKLWLHNSQDQRIAGVRTRVSILSVPSTGEDEGIYERKKWEREVLGEPKARTKNELAKRKHNAVERETDTEQSYKANQCNAKPDQLMKPRATAQCQQISNQEYITHNNNDNGGQTIKRLQSTGPTPNYNRNSLHEPHTERSSAIVYFQGVIARAGTGHAGTGRGSDFPTCAKPVPVARVPGYPRLPISDSLSHSHNIQQVSSFVISPTGIAPQQDDNDAHIFVSQT
ncbi:hypothetical protein EDB85DRAFT_1893433 [Lactarius pseudohatsudake]|nr:hypothetical protein EDB85DRAFT_1893433 [Lactarius pseudohatsudake]